MIDDVTVTALARALELSAPPSPDLARAANEQLANLRLLWKVDVDDIEALTDPRQSSPP